MWNKSRRTSIALTISIAACVLLSGCEGLALTAAGVGGSAAVSHTLNGITYRTFTAPLARVKGASMAALDRMAMKGKSSEKTEHGELIRARAAGREIEIELESISANTTRMKVVARNGGVFYDSSTATEIILQTERQLGNA